MLRKVCAPSSMKKKICGKSSAAPVDNTIFQSIIMKGNL